jgi:hypothetical protein
MRTRIKAIRATITAFFILLFVEKKNVSVNQMIDWKLASIAFLILVILYLLGSQKRKSGFSATLSKKPEESCPQEFRMLGPTICVKD